MGVLDAAMHAEEMKRQGFQDIRDAMGQVTETNKASRFKEAGKRLAELGGLSKENLKQVVTEFRLDPEQTKELVTTWGSFHKTMREMEGKTDKVPAGDVGQFYGIYGRNPKSAEELKTFLESARPDKQPQEFAPEHETWRQPETGKTVPVNLRDPEERRKFEAAGYGSIGPRAGGYLRESGILGAKSENELIEASSKARGAIANLDVLNNLMDRVKTGKFAGWKKTVQQVAEYINLPGVDTANLSAAEAFTAITDELALRSRNLGPGMVLAGQMSDRDLTFLKNMNAQLITSKGGNKLIIGARKKLLERELEVAALAEKYKAQHGGIFDSGGFEAYVRKEMSNDSAFGIPEKAKFTGREDPETGLPIYEVNGKFFIPEF